ncbi:hypothetical protein BX616_009554, partial [Lobosporangium transversale]
EKARADHMQEQLTALLLSRSQLPSSQKPPSSVKPPPYLESSPSSSKKLYNPYQKRMIDADTNQSISTFFKRHRPENDRD